MPTCKKESQSEAFASLFAYASHSITSIPPLGSAILIPLSSTGLCEAVIMSPVACFVFRERSPAKTPDRKTVDSKSDASVRKPAVPYENFTPVEFGPLGKFQPTRPNRQL
jgi:hypothetical protein